MQYYVVIFGSILLFEKFTISTWLYLAIFSDILQYYVVFVFLLHYLVLSGNNSMYLAVKLLSAMGSICIYISLLWIHCIVKLFAGLAVFLLI